MTRWIATGLLLASLPAAAGKPGKVKPPKNSVALHVDDVAPTGDGHVVFLTDAENERIVPINVGESEAITIAFRLAGRSHDRPFTHDLFDQAVRGLGGEIVQVHVHSLTEGVFHARVTLRQKRRLLHLDARASDSIALAMSGDLPIWMDGEVFEDTGVTMIDLLQSLRQLDGPAAVPLQPPPESEED